jgi:hydrogenase maturation protease
MRTAILGIGNLLMEDEGFGIHVVREVAQRSDLPADVEVIDGGTSGLELLPQLHEVDHLIIIDAVRSGQLPGSILCLKGEQIPAFLKTVLSSHQTGVASVIAMMVFQGIVPSRVALFGVEPVRISLGLDLTPKVRARVLDVIKLVFEELELQICVQ